MKNLILLSERRHSASLKSSSITPSHNEYIAAIVPNPNADHDMTEDYGEQDTTPYNFALTPSGQLYALSSIDTVIWSLNLTSIESGESVPESEVVSDETGGASPWFHLSYNESSEVLVALSHSGAIVSVDPLSVEAELIGAFDHGIQCAAWSEDKEVLALVTFQYEDPMDGSDLESKMQEGASSVPLPVLMTMNTSYEILSEVSLPAHTDGESISLCWNKKTDEPLIAISTHDVSDSTRKIRIYNGQTLDITSVGRSEDGSGKILPNLLNPRSGSALSWAGAATSSLLTCIQRKGKKSKNVVFIESNGLQHGGFKLNHVGQHEEVVGLTYNAENDVLAITLLSKSPNDDGDATSYGKVQLYHRCNYHWYLKYELSFPADMCVTGTRFDDIKGYDLTVLMRSKHSSDDMSETKLEWRRYTFIWDSSTISPTGTATVIDGTSLNITHFNKAVIPPPMCATSLTFDRPVIGVAHEQSISSLTSAASNCSVSLVAQLSDGSLSLCGYDDCETSTKPTRERALVQLGTVDLYHHEDPPTLDETRLRQSSILEQMHNGDSLYVGLLSVVCSLSAGMSAESLCYMIAEIKVAEGTKTTNLVYVKEIQVDSCILRVARWADCAGHALVEFVDGTLVNFSSSISAWLNNDDVESVSPCEESLLEPCPWIAGLLNDATGRPLVIGLSSRYRLYCGERLLCSASSSFTLSPTHEFLSYVTLGSRAQLRFLPLSVLSDFDPLMGSDDNLDILTQGYEPRDVERGSRMVAVLPQKPSVIIQLPRGNLELLNPRALVLPHIMTLIENREYRLAIDLMRRQKVDMNLIVDMDPHHFVADGVRKLIKQVTNVDHLNLFIASLNNSDVTEWKYPIPRWFRRKEKTADAVTAHSQNTTFDFTTKVNQVCAEMRSAMISTAPPTGKYDEYYLLPILSTFAKQDPPKLDDALSLIKSNAESFISSSAKKTSNSILLSDKAQSSIQYLAFLADYEHLFNTALGMYDFDMAKGVARNSQMDPKVYLPMLKRFRSLPKYVSRYEVDLKLKRYDSALRHFHKSCTSDDDNTCDEDSFMKCLKLIEEYGLYRLGLELFYNQPRWHNQIMISLGESLLRENKADSALSIFMATNPVFLEGAKRAARQCGDWKSYFACLTKVIKDGNTEEQFDDVAAEVAEEVASGRGGMHSRREGIGAGARILVDYGRDIPAAVDMLISGELWFEARRLAIMSDSDELLQQVVDAAVSYGHSCIDDFESRSEKFVKANKRYAEVVEIQRDLKQKGEELNEDNLLDETGSQFSMASNVSNASIRSTSSTSSVGSVSSVSSVISASSISSFSIVGVDSLDLKHKSKFNQIGRQKKKKKKTSKRKHKLVPGSEDELKSLVTTLKGNLVDAEYYAIVIETIQFLSQVHMTDVSREMYDAYESFKLNVNTSQKERICKTTQNRQEQEQKARREGQHFQPVNLDCEKEIDELGFEALPSVIHDFFSYMT